MSNGMDNDEYSKPLSKAKKTRVPYQARKSEHSRISSWFKSAKQRGIDIGMELGRIEGNIEGLEAGMERGKIEGISLGLEYGRKSEAKKIAENLLKMGLVLEMIVGATELPLEKVLQIQKTLKS